MGKQRILIAIVALFMSQSTVVFADDNPFNKGASVDIGSDNQWKINNKTATRSGSSSGDFYHLFYDRKQLRLRITDGAEDSEATAKKYQHFVVEDVQVDGNRLSIFQWCLGNQQKHSRFLEQGLKVKQNVCNNQGEKGAFIMRLNAKTLGILKNGKKLSFKIKPFRSSINVNFDISDFSDLAAKLKTKVKLVKEATPAAKIAAAKKCKVTPPKNFTKIRPAEYVCNDAIAKAGAEASIAAMVKERKRQVKLVAERKAAKQAKELTDKKAAEDKLAAEQAALAATEASKKEVSSAITNKMLAVCKKKWDAGEHRCYCEKFIKHAPVGIESDPSCAGG